MSLTVHSLRWSDIDPRVHDVDLARVEAVVGEAMSAAVIGRPTLDTRVEIVDRALLAHFGPSVVGWQWTVGEGGVISSYCCTACSLTGNRDHDTGVIIAAVREWRRRLVEIADLLAELRVRGAKLDLAGKASLAVSALLGPVLAWTYAEDAWYSTFSRLLSWYLEQETNDPREAVRVAEAAVDGRFESWCEPGDEQIDAVAATVQLEVRRQSDPVLRDALAEWLVQRGELRLRRKGRGRKRPVSGDAHARYIDEVDARRDSDRADRMTKALAETRARARAGDPLSLELLIELHQLVMDSPGELRSTDAFAHDGAERYGFIPDMHERFRAVLEEAGQRAIAAPARAARVYLDVCYFHPFTDGNARAARLALDYVLTRAGLALHAAGPVFLMARRVHEQTHAYAFIYLVEYLAGHATRDR